MGIIGSHVNLTFGVARTSSKTGDWEEHYSMLLHLMLDGWPLRDMIFDAEGKPVA